MFDKGGFDVLSSTLVNLMLIQWLTFPGIWVFPISNFLLFRKMCSMTLIIAWHTTYYYTVKTESKCGEVLAYLIAKIDLGTTSNFFLIMR